MVTLNNLKTMSLVFLAEVTYPKDVIRCKERVRYKRLPGSSRPRWSSWWSCRRTSPRSSRTGQRWPSACRSTTSVLQKWIKINIFTDVLVSHWTIHNFIALIIYCNMHVDKFCYEMWFKISICFLNNNNFLNHISCI